MPRPGEKLEKSKDFKGAMIRLFNSLDKWRKLLIISLLLALLSAILSTIAPNQLSNLTDVVTEGIKPDITKLEKISKKMTNNMLSNYMKTNPNKKPTQEELVYYISPIKVDGVTISTKDQQKLIQMASTMKESQVTEKSLSKLDELPKSVQKIIEPKINKKDLYNAALVLAIIYILSSIFSYVQGIVMAYLSNNFAKKLRTDISEKINKLPLKYFDNHETGDVLSRITNDVDSIGFNLNTSLSTLVTSITLFVGSIIMMFITNWIMALTAIASSIFGFAGAIFLLKKSQKYFSERQEELGNLNGHIEEIYSGHNVVKTYNGEKKALKEFDEINNKLYNCNRKSQFLSGIMQPIMHFVGNFGYVAVCVVGALLVMNNKTTFGTIVAFMIYIRLFTNPLSQIAQALTSLQSTGAAAERVFEFVDEKEEPNEKDLTDKLEINDIKGEIEFKDVKFGYNDNKLIIKDFSAKASPGQKIAIVGPTGAGKTTMVNLLMKFYEINDGDILIDGISTENLTRENIHDLFVMVLQDTWLFDGTIRENLKFNKKDITDEEIMKACETVGIDHFIKTLPGGLDANVGDNESISSGQKQLLTIARGMIKDAPFLILDEATSNVDTRTEELVQKAMDKLTEGKTSFIIAHRLSTIKNADLILVMKDGNIIEQGNHENLMKQKGFYAELYNSQFEL